MIASWSAPMSYPNSDSLNPPWPAGEPWQADPLQPFNVNIETISVAKLTATSRSPAPTRTSVFTESEPHRACTSARPWPIPTSLASAVSTRTTSGADEVTMQSRLTSASRPMVSTAVTRKSCARPGSAKTMPAGSKRNVCQSDCCDSAGACAASATRVATAARRAVTGAGARPRSAAASLIRRRSRQQAATAWHTMPPRILHPRSCERPLSGPSCGGEPRRRPLNARRRR